MQILAIAPFNNPHIVPVYDQLASQADDSVQVIRASLRPLHPSRLELGWIEMGEDSPYLQPWRRWADRWAYYKALWQSDIIIFPGFQHFRTLPLHHWFRRLSGKPAMLWSEPFLGHHKRHRMKYWISAAMKSVVNSPKVHLLAVGGESTAEEVLAVGGASRWQQWTYAFSVEPVKQLDHDLKVPSEGPVKLLYTGSLIERKDVGTLLKALGNSSLRDEDWCLRLVGDGDRRSELEQYARDLGIDSRLIFAGSCAHDQVAEAYQQADVLILPSRFDGWGAVVNEAMEYGLAVIASDRVGSSMLINQGENGYVYPRGDAQTLAEQLSSLIRNREKLSSFKLASRRLIVQYRPDESALRLLALCKAIAGGEAWPEYTEGLCCRLDAKRWPLAKLLNERSVQ